MLKLAALLLLCSPLLAQEWRSGDCHAHGQLCDNTDLTLAQVIAEKDAAGLDFTALQLWARFADLPEYLSLAPLVTGNDVAPGVRYGVEVSGFLASQFGHLQILDARDGAFPVLALHSGPILDYYDSALCGYAHVRWREDYQPVAFFGGVGGAYGAPVDAALRSTDFLETMEVEWDTPTTWRGLYYKLQSAGIRVGLAAGSDNGCGSHDGVGNPRTWAQAETYDEWCDEIRTGRTSISDGPEIRVELEVGSVLTASIGSPPGDGELAILVNGQIVASLPYLEGCCDIELTAALPTGSAWVAARAVGAHTAAQYVIVNDEPIAVLQDAAYWRDYCTAFEANIGAFSVPSAEAEIVARIRAAKDVYAALAVRASPWPAWAGEYGTGTPADHGPISIGLAGTKIDCLAAPSSAPGWLVIGVAPAALSISGITLLVNPGLPYALVPVASSAGGYAKALTAIPAGKHFYAQFVFPKPGGGLCSSDGLDAVMP